MSEMSLAELMYLTWMMVNFEAEYGESEASRAFMNEVRDNIRIKRLGEVKSGD